MSDDDGTYSVELTAGSYTATCASPEGTCFPSDAGGDAARDVTVPDVEEVDFVVSATSSPAPENDASPEHQCHAAGYNVCGLVTQDGQPVSGVVIEAKFGNQNQTTTTNDVGAYGLKLEIPVATLLCVETDSMLDENLICQADGSGGGPVSVDSDESGRVVNFTVIPS